MVYRACAKGQGSADHSQLPNLLCPGWLYFHAAARLPRRGVWHLSGFLCGVVLYAHCCRGSDCGVVHHLRSKSRSQWQGSLGRSSARLLNPLRSLPRPWQDAGFASNVTMINSALHLCKISLAKLASAIRETMRICGRQKLG